METKRAVLYARVSGDDRSNEGRNLEGQIEMCRQHALSKGWRIIAELAEDDRGASGAELDLPKLNQFLALARNNEFDVLVVREIDRLSRSLPKQLFLEDELKKYSVQIEYVLGEYADTPEGNFLKNVRAAVAELERLKINERSMRGRIQAVKAGSVLVFGKPPYGYDVVQKDGKFALQIQEDEAKWVRLIYEWYTNGDDSGKIVPLIEIARRLTELGVPTYSDSRRPPQDTSRVIRHGRWSKVTINKILRNSAYMGVWRFGKKKRRGTRTTSTRIEEQIPVAVPAIVSEEIWNAAQARLNANLRKAKRNRKHSYLLVGHISCGCCNARARGRWMKREQTSYHYYVCGARSYKDSYRHTCDAPYFRGESVDAAVWNWLKSLLTDPAILEIGLRAQQTNWHERNAPVQAQLTQIEEQIAGCRSRQERLLDLYLNGKIPMATWDERNAHLQSKLEGLTIEHARLRATLDDQAITEKQIQDIRDFATRIAESINLADENYEIKRRIIEMLNVEVSLCIDDQSNKYARASCVLDNEGLSITFNPTPHRDRPHRAGRLHTKNSD